VLARAYQEQLAAHVVGPSSDEIDRYYESRPAVFAQRRLYTIQEFAVDADAQQATALAGIAKRARSADEVEGLLGAASLAHRTRRFVQAAEDVPAVKLDKGHSFAVTQGAGPRIFTVIDVQSASIDRRLAADSIAGYLTNERKRQVVAPAMKSLRDKAQIQYQGGFAKAPSAAAPASGAN
jgi:hypothetical protein